MKVAAIDPLLRDKALIGRIDLLKADIERWASERELWSDSIFRTPFAYRSEAPFEGEILYLSSDAPIVSIFNPDHEEWDRLEEEFRGLLAERGFWYETQTHSTALITSDDEAVKADYLKLYRWQWIQHLAEERLYDVHAEAFEHFARDPARLHALSWRQFEEFVEAIFRNQGFHTELGPGRGDGGIDHRLYQSQAIPEIVAVVQAKKYTDRPIGRDPVAALSAVAQLARAPRAIFVTTSRYQPAARDFALNTQGRLDFPSLELADLRRLEDWCGDIAQQLDRYFSGGTQAPPIIANRARTELTGKMVVASWGYNVTLNSFAMIEADFPHEVVLRPIASRHVSGDGQMGTEVPDENRPTSGLEIARFIAYKRAGTRGGAVTFWGNQKPFGLWDGQPQYFNSCD